MPSVSLHPTRCAICGTEGNASELYPANFDLDAFNPAVFSARRMPDRVHYRMVKCLECGLVRSDPVADSGALAQLYAQSSFDYGEEVENLNRTYARYLAELDRYGVRKDSLLEIGCGNGFFLKEALRHGYAAARGVEPSSAAIEQADPLVRDGIARDVMRPGLFEPVSIDVVCLFQVLDHIPDPSEVLRECFHVLRPGGFVLCLNHNVESISARLLKAGSPIVDIEHTYLFSPATMDRLFSDHGFEVKSTIAVFNRYSLLYLTRLLPLPKSIKSEVLGALKKTRMGSIPIWVPLGNLCTVARKPGG
jgi:SAM-dependent methyltransferase